MTTIEDLRQEFYKKIADARQAYDEAVKEPLRKLGETITKAQIDFNLDTKAARDRYNLAQTTLLNEYEQAKKTLGSNKN